MAFWRNLSSALCLLTVTTCSWAQIVNLTETVKAGDCFRIKIDMELAGELRVNRDGKQVSLKLTATANHELAQRVLDVSTQGVADKAACVYDKASATIGVGEAVSERSLRPKRHLVVVQRYKDQPLCYCPTGPFLHEERELVGEHFDVLALTGLLPGKTVALGDTWKVSNGTAQALCNFEGVTGQDLSCKLEQIRDKCAVIRVTGTATGIDLGAQVKLTIDATCRFDVAAGRLIALEWKQQDERDQGPASPASSVKMTVRLSRTAMETPATLSDVALVSVPDSFDPPPHMTHLEYHDPKDRFALYFPREWQPVAQTTDHLVLRLMERGDFVAQVTVTPWEPAEKGKHLTPEAFKEAMNETVGWEPEAELQASEVPAEEGRWIYRLSYQGKMDGEEVIQNFYLVAGLEGQQVVLAFTLTPKHVDRLGTRDLSLAGSVDFSKK
jgi:hypothetical protein